MKKNELARLHQRFEVIKLKLPSQSERLGEVIRLYTGTRRLSDGD
ncbi:hypothetical protein [Paenibacillus sp. 2KB_22]